MYVYLSVLEYFGFANAYVQSTFSGSNTDGSFTTAVSKLFLKSLADNLIAADLRQLGVIFLFLY